MKSMIIWAAIIVIVILSFNVFVLSYFNGTNDSRLKVASAVIVFASSGGMAAIVWMMRNFIRHGLKSYSYNIHPFIPTMLSADLTVQMVEFYRIKNLIKGDSICLAILTLACAVFTNMQYGQVRMIPKRDLLLLNLCIFITIVMGLTLI